MHIETASINRPHRPGALLPPVEATEARRTHFIQDIRKRRTLNKLLGVIVKQPGVLVRGCAAVVQMKGLTLRQRRLWLTYLAEALLVGRWMKRRRLEHLHVHFCGPAASVGLLTSLAWKIPYSLTIHGPEELLNAESSRLQDKLTHASFVFCISDFARSQLCALTPPAAWGKFKVIRLGVDPLLLRPPSRTERTGTRRYVRLVCTGRMTPAKGHLILLQAIKLLHERGVYLTATLIGSGPELRGLQDYVLRNNLAEWVTFTSILSHSDTLAHLRRSDVFALASFAEGLPISLIEAMSLGLPCVSTTVGGVPELIRNGRDGLLVPPANPVALADALETLVSDPALRRSLGASARQQIINQYNLPLNQELLAHTFKSWISKTVATGG